MSAQDLRPADYLRRAREIRAAADGSLVEMKVAFLSTYTLEFVEPFLVVEAAERGLSVDTYFGAFGQFEQEVANPGAELRSFEPDALVLAMRPEDVDPDAIARYHATRGARYSELTGELVDRLRGLIDTFRGWSKAPVLVANFAPPQPAPFGLFDANLPESVAYAVAKANACLRERINAHAGAAIWDYAGLVGASGAADWTDSRLWSLARIPVAAANQPCLAKHLARTLGAVRWKPAKCLVLDLDNTLWGGVIGDDGIEGIQLGDDYPGVAYKAFQRSLLSLMDRGILLAVVSKNETDVVEEAFREHPEMLLKWEQLAALRVNWEPKSRNIQEIAAELNIGSDTLVLFDDNPVERAEVRANAPEVGVIEVPPDPLRYIDALWSSGYFDRLSLSDEDRSRTDMYRAERSRRAQQQSFQNVEDFLGSLEMVAEVGRATRSTLGRITQLVNKTNQFNLTTRRRSQAELEALSENPASVVAWLRVRDRFGDQGLIGVAILKQENDAATIDTFLMSCRVMNRHVEDAMLAYLVECARERGQRRLVGEYYPTRKNGMVQDFYSRFGFREEGELDDGGRRYVLDLDSQQIEWPAVIERHSDE